MVARAGLASANAAKRSVAAPVRAARLATCVALGFIVYLLLRRG